MKRTTTLSNSKTTIVISNGQDPVAAIPVQGGEDAQPIHDDAPEPDEIEDGQPQPESDLDEDPDVSLVGSIYLHLLSEHTCYEALRLSDDDAIALHQRHHQQNKQQHAISDWRFRPGRALAASMRGTQQVNDSPTDIPTV